MRMADAMIRTLLESVPDGVFVTNSDRAIVELNGKAAAMFGYRRDELLGQPRDRLMAKRPHTFSANPGLDLYVGCRKDRVHFTIQVDVSSAETELGALDIIFIRGVPEREALPSDQC